MLLILCAFKCYVKYLYRHISLDGIFGNIKVSHKRHLPLCYRSIAAVEKNKNFNLFGILIKHLSVV